MQNSITNSRGYIGTYTKGESKGIYSFTFDPENETITDVQLVAELENPTYVTISNDNKHLYAVAKEGELGGVSAYSINSQTGGLHFLNKHLETGSSPCHISVTQGKEHVVTANYHKGTIDLYSTHPEKGTITSFDSTVQHTGSGPNTARQEKPHAHYSDFTPDGKYIVAIDLGIDKLITYKIDNGALTEVHSLSVKPGSGPRHLEFHPNGNMAYLMTELSNEVITLSYNSENGSFTELQYIPTIPETFTENSQGSAIHVSSDGRFVYVSNRGHNSIAVFSVNEQSGELTFVEHTGTEGDWPRDFMFDPSERFLIVANQETSNLVLYSRNEDSGKLTLLNSDVTVPYPVCVKFLNK